MNASSANSNVCPCQGTSLVNATLPAIQVGDLSVTRLIVGGNPFSGNSHVSAEMDRAFVDYYSAGNIKKALFECERNGLNTVQARGDRHIRRVLREYWNEGGTMQWIAQTASEYRDLFGHVRQIAKEAAAIYVHGTFTDRHWEEKTMGEVRDLLNAIRDAGVPAGIGTHFHEVVEYVEHEGWEPDFYMTCFYRLGERRESPVVTGTQVKEEYDPADRERMCETIRATPRPCLAFKILAASRNCKTPEDVRSAFEFAFENIKPTDAVVVGVFQRDVNQVKMNAGIVRELLAMKQAKGQGNG